MNLNENRKDELIVKSKLNKEENMEKKEEKEKEVRTYRNVEEKEWNNITNGQIIPEKIIDDNKNKK